MTLNVDRRYISRLKTIFNIQVVNVPLIVGCDVPREMTLRHPTNYKKDELAVLVKDFINDLYAYHIVVKFYLMYVVDRNKCRVSDFEIALWDRVPPSTRPLRDIGMKCGLTPELYKTTKEKLGLVAAYCDEEVSDTKITANKCIIVAILEKHHIPHTIRVNAHERVLIDSLVYGTLGMLLKPDDIKSIAASIYDPQTIKLSKEDVWCESNIVGDTDTEEEE